MPTELARAMVVVGVDTSRADRGLDRFRLTATSKLQQIQRVADTFKRTLFSFQGLGFGLGFGSLIRSASQFEHEMGRVGAITESKFVDIKTGAMQVTAAFGSMREAAIAASKKTMFTATETARAMATLGQFGFSTDEIINSLSGTLNLAAAEMISVEQSAEILARSVRGLGVDISDGAEGLKRFTHLTDVIAKAALDAGTNVVEIGEALKYVGPMAVQAGAEIEEVVAAIAKMSDAGVNASMAGTSLRAVFTRLSAPTKAMIATMKDLNFDPVDRATGKLKPLNRLVDDLGASIAHLDEFQKTGVMAELAGLRGMVGFTPLVEMGGKAIRDFRKGLEQADGTAQMFGDTVTRSVIGQFKIMLATASAMAISFENQLRPALIGLIEPWKQLFDKVAMLDATTKEFIVSTGVLTFRLAGVALVLPVVAGGIAVVAKSMLFLATNPVGLAITAIGGLAYWFGKLAVDAEVGEKVRGIFVDLLEVVLDFSATLFGATTISDRLRGALGVLRNAVGDVNDWLKQAIFSLKDLTVNWLTRFRDLVVRNKDSIYAFGSAIRASFVLATEYAAAAASHAAEQFGVLGAAIAEVMRGPLQWLKQELSDFWGGLEGDTFAEKMASLFAIVAAKIKEAFDTGVKWALFFIEKVGDVKDAISELSETYIPQIADAFWVVAEKAKRATDIILEQVGRIKGALGLGGAPVGGPSMVGGMFSGPAGNMHAMLSMAMLGGVYPSQRYAVGLESGGGGGREANATDYLKIASAKKQALYDFERMPGESLDAAKERLAKLTAEVQKAEDDFRLHSERMRQDAVKRKAGVLAENLERFADRDTALVARQKLRMEISKRKEELDYRYDASLSEALGEKGIAPRDWLGEAERREDPNNPIQSPEDYLDAWVARELGRINDSKSTDDIKAEINQISAEMDAIEKLRSGSAVDHNIREVLEKMFLREAQDEAVIKGLYNRARQEDVVPRGLYRVPKGRARAGAVPSGSAGMFPGPAGNMHAMLAMSMLGADPKGESSLREQFMDMLPASIKDNFSTLARNAGIAAAAVAGLVVAAKNFKSILNLAGLGGMYAKISVGAAGNDFNVAQVMRKQGLRLGPGIAARLDEAGQLGKAGAKLSIPAMLAVAYRRFRPAAPGPGMNLFNQVEKMAAAGKRLPAGMAVEASRAGLLGKIPGVQMGAFAKLAVLADKVLARQKPWTPVGAFMAGNWKGHPKPLTPMGELFGRSLVNIQQRMGVSLGGRHLDPNRISWTRSPIFGSVGNARRDMRGRFLPNRLGFAEGTIKGMGKGSSPFSDLGKFFARFVNLSENAALMALLGPLAAGGAIKGRLGEVFGASRLATGGAQAGGIPGMLGKVIYGVAGGFKGIPGAIGSFGYAAGNGPLDKIAAKLMRGELLSPSEAILSRGALGSRPVGAVQGTGLLGSVGNAWRGMRGRQAGSLVPAMIAGNVPVSGQLEKFMVAPGLIGQRAATGTRNVYAASGFGAGTGDLQDELYKGIREAIRSGPGQFDATLGGKEVRIVVEEVADEFGVKHRLGRGIIGGGDKELAELVKHSVPEVGRELGQIGTAGLPKWMQKVAAVPTAIAAGIGGPLAAGAMGLKGVDWAGGAKKIPNVIGGALGAGKSLLTSKAAKSYFGAALSPLNLLAPMEKFKAPFTAFAKPIGQAMQGAKYAGAGMFGQLAAGAGSIFSGVARTEPSLGPAVAGKTMFVGPDGVVHGAGAGKQVAGGFKAGGLASGLAEIGPLLKSIVTGEGLIKSFQAAFKALTGTVAGFAAVFGGVVEFSIAFGVGLVAGIGYMTDWAGIWETITTLASDLFAMLLPALTELGSLLLDVSDLLFIPLKLMFGLGFAIGELIGTALEPLLAVLAKVVHLFGVLFTGALSVAIDILRAVFNVIGLVGKALLGMTASFVSWLTGVKSASDATGAWNTVLEVLRTVFQGIGNILIWVIDKVEAFVYAIKGAARALRVFTETGSPTKAMEAFGQVMAERTAQTKKDVEAKVGAAAGELGTGGVGLPGAETPIPPAGIVAKAAADAAVGAVGGIGGRTAVGAVMASVMSAEGPRFTQGGAVAAEEYRVKLARAQEELAAAKADEGAGIVGAMFGGSENMLAEQERAARIQRSQAKVDELLANPPAVTLEASAEESGIVESGPAARTLNYLRQKRELQGGYGGGGGAVMDEADIPLDLEGGGGPPLDITRMPATPFEEFADLVPDMSYIHQGMPERFYPENAGKPLQGGGALRETAIGFSGLLEGGGNLGDRTAMDAIREVQKAKRERELSDVALPDDKAGKEDENAEARSSKFIGLADLSRSIQESQGEKEQKSIAKNTARTADGIAVLPSRMRASFALGGATN